MKTIRIMVVAMLIVVSGLALHVATAQQAGTKRADLQLHVIVGQPLPIAIGERSFMVLKQEVRR